MKKFQIQLIEGWTSFYKMYSIYGIAFMAVMPDIWNLIVASGVLDSEDAPKGFSYLLKVVALVVAILRLVKQKSLTPPAEEQTVVIQQEEKPKM